MRSHLDFFLPLLTGKKKQAAEIVSEFVDLRVAKGKKPYTIKYLEQRFHTKAVKQAKPLDANNQPTGPDVGIIIGNDYNLSGKPTTTSTTKP